MLIIYDDACRKRIVLVNNMSINVYEDIHKSTGICCVKDINRLSTI